jgi:ornithine cyclodeaminase/alanine dehydrogenase-like protein (mu-crystallin family)
VTYYGENRARGHPTLYASYLLMDGTTGEPLALLEGTYLTGMRTGATSALAARYLARADSRRVACLGAGVQAGFQLRCLAALLPIERVTVVGRDAGRARAFADAMRAELGIAIDVGTDARRAVRDADVVTWLARSSPPARTWTRWGPSDPIPARSTRRRSVARAWSSTPTRACSPKPETC